MLGEATPYRMKITTLSLSVLLSLPGVLLAETADEIAASFDKQKIAAIQAYLEKNPDATDQDEALSILVESHLGIEEFGPVPDLIRKRYEGVDKGPEADLGLIVNEIVRPLIEACVVSGQRDKAKDMLARVKEDLAAHPQGGQVAQFLDQIGGELYLPGPGDEMKIAFTALDGREVDLAKMTEKVVLVDFWATWCGPCVAEMPNVIAAYQKYHEKGFEIVGISLDEDKAAVEKFTAERGMPWPQFVDGKGWENQFVAEYGIRGIPATFLIGKGGKIVASNLRGPALEEALEKELGGE